MLSSFLRREAVDARAAVAVAIATCALSFFLLRRSSAKTKTLEEEALEAAKAAYASLPVPPTTLPVLGNVLDLLRNNDVLHDWVLANCERVHPSPFVIRAPGRPDMLVVSTPEAFEDVVKTQFDVFGKGPGIHMRISDLLGDSLTLVDGGKWRVQRKILASLFSARTLREAITRIIQKNARVLLSILEQQRDGNTPFDLCNLLGRFTIEVFAEIGFGLELGGLAAGEASQFEQAFDRAQYIVTTRFTQPTALWKLKRLASVGLEGELKRCVQVIDATVLTLIDRSLNRTEGEKQRASDEGRHDIVSMAIDAMTADHEAFDAKLLRALSVSALVAGRDTTSQTFCWFIFMLTQHPEVELKLRDELLAKLPKLRESTDWVPAMEDVHDLPFLEACLKETLRLYPAAALNSRVANHDTMLSDGTFVPEGATVLFPSYTMGRLEALWGHDAREFKPERWLDPDKPGKLVQVSPFKFNAFLAGPRMCVGMNLAMLELKVLAATTLGRFHFAAEPHQHVTYQRSISLPMRDPFMVRAVGVPHTAPIA